MFNYVTSDWILKITNRINRFDKRIVSVKLHKRNTHTQTRARVVIFECGKIQV